MAEMLGELNRAIEAARLDDKPRFAATVELARSYATAIDSGAEDLAKVGPPLLAALVQLGLTVAGKLAKGGEPDADKPANPLDELRARRERRNAS